MEFTETMVLQHFLKSPSLPIKRVLLTILQILLNYSHEWSVLGIYSHWTKNKATGIFHVNKFHIFPGNVIQQVHTDCQLMS